jgi:hypothetical protein
LRSIGLRAVRHGDWGRPTAILKVTRHPYLDIRSALGSAAIPRGQEPALACNQRAAMAGAARPIMDDLAAFLDASLATISGRSELAKAIR